MKPSRALYIILGALLLAGATINPPFLLMAAIVLVGALAFDSDNM